MSQPLDRRHACRQLGEVDTKSGEFWVDSPFQMPSLGHNLSAYERNKLFINVNGRHFLDASYFSTADIDSDSRSVVTADFDRDGAVDLLVASVGGGPLRLFRNRIPTTFHRVRVELRGKKSNRPAIGARVVLTCGSRKITRDLFPANGFMGTNPVELVIGVGDSTTIDNLTIRWPNGSSQSHSSLPVDQRLQFTEGEADYRALGL